MSATISDTPGSDGDYTYSFTSYGQQTDRWQTPAPALDVPPVDCWDDLSDLLDTPTFPVYHDETRDADGELLEEFAEPHREVA